MQVSAEVLDWVGGQPARRTVHHREHVSVAANHRETGGPLAQAGLVPKLLVAGRPCASSHWPAFPLWGSPRCPGP